MKDVLSLRLEMWTRLIIEDFSNHKKIPITRVCILTLMFNRILIFTYRRRLILANVNILTTQDHVIFWWGIEMQCDLCLDI